MPREAVSAMIAGPTQPALIDAGSHVPNRPTGPAASVTADKRREYGVRLIQTALVVAGLAMMWRLSTLVLLGYGSVVVAVLLRAFCDRLARVLRLPQRWAFGLTVFLCMLIFVASVALFGSTLARQFKDLAVTLPSGLQALAAQLGPYDTASDVLNAVRERFLGAHTFETLSQLFTGAAGLFGGMLLVFIGGVYLAAQPLLYKRGFLALLPGRSRLKTERLLDVTGSALRHWMVGQLATMFSVGLLTGCGAWLIGLPSAAALGVIAGLLEFLPFIGPVATVVPAVLLALPLGQEAVLLVVLLVFAVQQMEGNLLTPIIQRKAISLPPAVTLFALIGMGILFGIAGVFLAMPLTVVVYVALRELYLPEMSRSHSAPAELT